MGTLQEVRAGDAGNSIARSYGFDHLECLSSDKIEISFGLDHVGGG